MKKLCAATVTLALGAAAAWPAHADIFTWTDASGRFNVSNVEPPKDVNARRIVQKATQPMSDSARAAAQAAEVQALKDRVAQLQSEVDRANQRADVAYAAPQPAPSVVVVAPAPAYAPPPPSPPAADYASADTYTYACDPLTFGCPPFVGYTAFGYPAFGYPVGVVVVNKGHGHRGERFHGQRRFNQFPARPVVPGRPVMPMRSAFAPPRR